LPHQNPIIQMMKEPSLQDQFNELSYYTLQHPDQIYFIHQHIVDAWQAQTADAGTKPITLFFSLAGLYLHLEKQYSGRQVQQAHSELAQNKKEWPKIELPLYRGSVTVAHVLQTDAGPQRDLMIRSWCNSVWKAYQNSHKLVAAFVITELRIK
jgi:hypothetical protein